MKRIILSILCLFMLQLTWAQVSGTVTDEFDFPIANAVVENPETNITVYTDGDGFYEIDADKGQTLLFFTLDGIEQSRTVGDDKVLDVKLTSTVELKGVVAVGYGTQKKELVSSAVSSIDSEEILENNPISVGDALQGKSSGVQINQSSGTPGATPNIRIRGITTNGDNSPLIIMDGVIIGTDFSVVDPNDIAKIDVVKDASTAIYGIQGQNGVILITSKSGKANKKTRFTYNGSYSVQEAQNVMDLMNAKEYAAYWNESDIADGGSASFPDFQSYGNGTDWQAQLFETSPSTSHYLSATGGSENVSYSISGSYLDQDGIIAPDKANYRRYTLKNNLGIDLTDKLKLNTMILYANTKKHEITESGRGSVLYYADNASPLDPVYDGSVLGTTVSNGFYYVNSSSQEMINPMAVLYNTFNETKTNRYTGKIELVYEPIKNLDITGRFNFNKSDQNTRSYSPLAYYGPGKVNNNVSVSNSGTAYASYILDTDDNGERDVYPTMYQYTVDYFQKTWEAFANYKTSFGDNNFTFMLGTSYQNEQGDYTTISGYLTNGSGWGNAYLSNTTPYIPDSDLDASGTVMNPSYVKTDYSLLSYFGRVQYDYAGKYLFSAILRRDASTHFSPENQVGYFPALSAGWVVSKEDFFKSNLINKFKIRASWGITGNDNIGADAYLALMQTNPEAEYPFGDVLYQGTAIGRLSNTDLQWETTTQTDIGFDLSLFNRDLDITADYFLKDTDDLLLYPEISAITGAYAPGSGLPAQNAGSVRNQGVELNIAYNHDFSDNFSFHTGVNFLFLDNEVTATNGADLYGGTFSLSTQTSRMTVGSPMGAFFGYIADGIYQNQAEIDAHATQAGAEPGDIRYVDVDGDGVVEFGSDDDLAEIGNPIPDFTIGYNIGANYKNFDVGMSLYASIGNDVVRAYERFQSYNNRLSYYLNRWHGEGTSNEVPRASNAASRNTEFSTFYVEDGSYLRIQNVQIGYDFAKILKNAGFSKARLYFAVNNLYTFTKYMGYTPEINNAYPLSAGVDGGQFPSVRTFVTGLTLNF